LGGSRILSNQGTDNLFAGIGAGAANTTGRRNAFFGRNAGNASTGSNDSTFFGFNAGLKQANSFANSFFGSGAGQENINGNSLAFFGTNAGNKNVTGINNSFYGNAAGQENTSGSFNTFLGFAAGFNNTTGGNNIFIGNLTGNVNTATQINNSVAIGNGISVSTSDTIIIGKTSQNTQIPGKLLMGGGVMMSGNFVAQSFSNLGFEGLYTGNLVLDNNLLNNVLPSQVHLCIRTTSLGGGFGGEMLTRCTVPFSSVADKTDVKPFAGGIEIVKRLKPVAFKWKDGASEIGLNAEDVAEIAPLLVTRNEKGEIEAVKENGLSVVLINAIKEQQKQIEAQAAQIEELKKLVCAANPNAAVCKE
jgi:trimeric autotransporter adhesin